MPTYTWLVNLVRLVWSTVLAIGEKEFEYAA